MVTVSFDSFLQNTKQTIDFEDSCLSTSTNIQHMVISFLGQDTPSLHHSLRPSEVMRRVVRFVLLAVEQLLLSLLDCPSQAINGWGGIEYFSIITKSFITQKGKDHVKESWGQYSSIDLMALF